MDTSVHPNELKNHALVAASVAELDGFTATAAALLNLALACNAVALRLQNQGVGGSRTSDPPSSHDRSEFEAPAH